MGYTAIFKKMSNGWYFAQCEQIPGAMTQGETIEEAKENLKDAINLMLEDAKEDFRKACGSKRFIRRKIAMLQMKRNQLIKHLLSNGCVLKREGGNHSVYINVKTRKRNAVPRHNEIGDIFCNEICKQLGIPPIK